MSKLLKALSAMLLGAGVLLVGCIIGVSNGSLSNTEKPIVKSPPVQPSSLTQLPPN